MPAHRPTIRLLLTLAALAALIVGYYLGQYWQRRPLHELSAMVYPEGERIDYPEQLNLAADDGADCCWRLFTTIDSRDAACHDLLRHYTWVINRLAAYPRIQHRLRLSALAVDNPPDQTIETLRAQRDWIEVIGATPPVLENFARDLGLAPHTRPACTPDAALVAPDRRRWALIPHGQAAIMAHDIRTLIEFVE